MKLQKLNALVISLVFGFALHAAANTEITVDTGSTNLDSAASFSGTTGATSDVTFKASTYSPAAFNFGSTSPVTVNWGTLNDLSTTTSGTITIDNAQSSTTDTLELSGGNNSVSGTAADYLYVASGANMAIGTVGTGTVDLYFGTGTKTAISGNIHNNGTLNIAAPIVFQGTTASQKLSFTGSGATTVSGGITTDDSNTVVVNNTGTVTFVTGEISANTTLTAGTLDANSQIAGNVVINGGTFSQSTAGKISGASAVNLTVNGGTVTLAGTSNSYTGAGGTTIEDTATLTLSGEITSTLTLGGSANGLAGGGTLNYSHAAVDTFTSTTLNAGASVVNPTASGATVGLAAITRNVGSTIDISPSATGTVTTTTANANFAGGQQTILGGYATWDGETTWAVSGTGATPGTITGLSSGSYSGLFLAGDDINPLSGTSTVATETINSLRFNGAYASTATLTGALTIATGGILETSNVGANANAINGSTLTSGNSQDLIVIQNNTASGLTISSQIIGGIGLTKSGSGTLTVSGSNTYSGPTTINAGTLNVTGSTAATSTFTINTGGALAGIGGTVGGPVTLYSGGSINLANSPIGTLTIGGLTTTGGGTLSFAIGGGTTATNVLADTGAYSVTTGFGNTTITIANLGGTAQTLSTGTYNLITAASAVTTTPYTLSDTTLDGATLSLAASGDDLELVVVGAAPTFTTGTYTLTTSAGASILHESGTMTLSTALSNTGTSGQDSIAYSGVGATGAGGTVNGSLTGSGTLTVGTGTTNSAQTFVAGASSGTFTISPTGSISGVSAGTPNGTTTGTTVVVYTGAGVWNATGSGSWGSVAINPTNWTADGGTPGLDPNFETTDSAYFGSSIGSSSATVTLNGASPYLNNITFNNSAGSYTIAQGSSGTIHLDSTGTATITDTAGSHTISAPVEFDSTVSDSVASSSTLTLSGNITQSGTQSFTLNGPGTTIISGSNSYTGGTTVASGSTFISNGSNGSALGSGPLTVTAGATFGGSGSATGLSSYTIGAVSSPVTTLQVGNGTDVTSNLTLTATGASSIKNTNLQFNLNSTGASNELKVGTTALTLSGDTLTLNITTVNVITANTPYILVAGTGGNGDGTLAGSQYSGLTSGGTAANGFQLIDGLTLDFTGVGAPAGWYNNSYVFLVNNGGVDDIEVEVVPEPGTWAMMIGGLALLVFIQRRRGARNGDNRLTGGKV